MKLMINWVLRYNFCSQFSSGGLLNSSAIVAQIGEELYLKREQLKIRQISFLYAQTIFNKQSLHR